jgi:uncharacterized NAD-dependent epimerase/dehydratase family protein
MIQHVVSSLHTTFLQADPELSEIIRKQDTGRLQALLRTIFKVSDPAGTCG